MFNLTLFNRQKNPAPPAAPAVPRERIAAIAAQKPPAHYFGEGETTGRAERRQVFRDGVAILPHGETLPVTIRNISAGGFGIHHEGIAPLPGRVLLTEPTLPVHIWGDLVWQTERAAGFRIVPR
jgi:hypothetical protein